MHELRDNAKDAVELDQTEPDTFLDIMGGVMDRYKLSVFWRLDPTVSLKLIYKEKFEKKKEEDE